MNETSDFLTLPQVATRLVVCHRTVYRMILGGALPGYRVGGQWRVKSEDVDAYLRTALRTFARRQGARMAV